MAARRLRVVPLARKPKPLLDKSEAKKRLGIPEHETLVCSFGMVDKLKLSDRLMWAWQHTVSGTEGNARLVFAGSDLKRMVPEFLAGRGSRRKNIRATGYVPAQEYDLYLAACDVAVQLRKQSRGETSAAVLDCLGAGVPTIVNAHGSFVELPEDLCVRISDDFDDQDLADVIDSLVNDSGKRMAMGTEAQNYMRGSRQPSLVAQRYFETIESLYSDPDVMGRPGVVQAISEVQGNANKLDFIQAARAVALNHPIALRRDLLIDATTLQGRVCATEPQRIARELATELLKNPPVGFRTELIVRGESGFCYARKLSASFLGLDRDWLDSDSAVEPKCGDVFLGLAPNPNAWPSYEYFLDELRARNGRTVFVVYDPTPLFEPKYFTRDTGEALVGWMANVAETADGIVTTSRYASELCREWIEGRTLARCDPIDFGYFQLFSGISRRADFAETSPKRASRRKDTFLMIGALEPRSGHRQVLAAFEQLWAEGLDVGLRIVGEEGPMSDDLATQIRGHREFGGRLIWNEASTVTRDRDTFRDASAMITASEGDDIGAPYMDAAALGLGIIARDRPAMRENLNGFTHYFTGDAPDAIARAVRDWRRLRDTGTRSSGGEARVRSCDDSARQLIECAIRGSWSAHLETLDREC
jgi:glycosyltransferase involved in cell wall biosynthesis